VSNLWLAARSLFWVVVLPGMVAGYIPWRFFGVAQARPNVSDALDVLGVALIAVGSSLLLICVWDFARNGRGTLAPVDAPRELVVQGLYRYVRNPMYVGVAIILLGELLLVRSAAFLIYIVAWFIIVNAFVILYEEPELRRRFSSSYDGYTHRVHRWIPQLPGKHQ
jgi:protein-S-isoprenylcysteine O-methyltransferase Ste14